MKDAQVHVAGSPAATSDQSSWTVAVLEVHPRNVSFQIGWRTQQFAPAEFYSEPVEPHEAKLAMGVGREDVWFVARPTDGCTSLVIELVEVTSLDDPKYAEVPRY